MTDECRRALTTAAIAAVGATVGIAGLGHLYLREWDRAAAWFSGIISSAVMLISITVGVETLTELSAIRISQVPPIIAVPIGCLLLLSTADAHQTAKVKMNQTELPCCVSCGAEIIPALSFCQWCARENDIHTQSK
jgi:hypothetical protein